MVEAVAVAVKGVTYWPLKHQGHPILNNVDLVIEPERLTGILGPSGGGKTTLLNVLAGRVIKGKLDGEVRYIPISSLDMSDETDISSRGFHKRLIGYVMANDLFQPGLTVEESLSYITKLKRMNLSREDERNIVERIIKEVDLQDYRNVRVNSDSKLPFSIAKRLSFAIELIDEPSILILDEPTTGLSPLLSIEMVKKLKKFAQSGGKTVICSLHQPRASVFNLFDDIVLVADGRVVYSGPSSQVVPYFELEIGFKYCPYWSPPDFALEAISSSSSLTRNTSLVHTSIIEKDDLYSNSKYGRMVQKKIDTLLSSKHQSITSLNVRPHFGFTKWINQVYILTKRLFSSRWRDATACWLLLLVSLIQGLLVGSIFWQLPSFLNDTHPIPLADVIKSSPLYNSSWFNSLIYGFNGNSYRPILNIIDYGVDGFGRSTLESILFDETLQKNLTNLLSFVYDNIGLESTDYPSTLWLDKIIQNNNETSFKVNKGTESTSNINFFQIDKLVIFKVLNICLKGLRLADHMYYKFDWNKFAVCENILTTEGVDSKVYYVCLVAQAKNLITLFLNNFLEWPYPEYTLTYVCKFYVRDFPCSKWLEEGRVNLNRFLESTDSLLLQNSTNFGLEDSLFEMINNFKLNDLIEDVVGLDELIDLIGPIQELYNKINKSSSFKLITAKVSKVIAVVKQCLDYAYVTSSTMFKIVNLLVFISLFFAVSVYDILVSFPQQRILFNREAANDLYYPSAYFVAKTLSGFLFEFISCIIVSTNLYFMVGFYRIGSRQVGQFITYQGICIIVTFALNGLAYLVSASSPRLEVSLLISPIILMLWVSLAVLRDIDFPFWMAGLKYLAIHRWALFAYVLNTFQTGGFFGSLPNEISYALAGVTETKIWFSCIMMLLIGISFRVLAFFALKFFNRNIGLEG